MSGKKEFFVLRYPWPLNLSEKTAASGVSVPAGAHSWGGGDIKLRKNLACVDIGGGVVPRLTMHNPLI
ncbi:hypothetical protein DO021_13885 [Desulfobacter hydrogenophilus]|uniref:Uncharacterized protein n=1 Tax=Desulfobacter hydrogenophilus TaxID=2291 RepID=A0A328F9U9_9BACT|nr:hypothetical protein DO021_13885 [Desulfobacter hydrogenophilus]